MNKRSVFFLTILAIVPFAFAVACHPVPDPAPTPPTDADAGDVYPVPPANVVEEFPEGSPDAVSSPCGKACDNLRAVGCKEGFPTDAGVTCYAACLKMAKKQHIPATCWASKHTRAEVVACGGIVCTAVGK